MSYAGLKKNNLRNILKSEVILYVKESIQLISQISF